MILDLAPCTLHRDESRPNTGIYRSKYQMYGQVWYVPVLIIPVYPEDDFPLPGIKAVIVGDMLRPLVFTTVPCRRRLRDWQVAYIE